MINHTKKIVRKIAGVLLIILGVLGAFVPIPIVPFFILIFIGLALLDIQHPLIDKLHEWRRARSEKKLTKAELVFAFAGSAIIILLAGAAISAYMFFFA